MNSEITNDAITPAPDTLSRAAAGTGSEAESVAVTVPEPAADQPLAALSLSASSPTLHDSDSNLRIPDFSVLVSQSDSSPARTPLAAVSTLLINEMPQSELSLADVRAHFSSSTTPSILSLASSSASPPNATTTLATTIEKLQQQQIQNQMESSESPKESTPIGLSLSRLPLSLSATGAASAVRSKSENTSDGSEEFSSFLSSLSENSSSNGVRKDHARKKAKSMKKRRRSRSSSRSRSDSQKSKKSRNREKRRKQHKEKSSKENSMKPADKKFDGLLALVIAADPAEEANTKVQLNSRPVLTAPTALRFHPSSINNSRDSNPNDDSLLNSAAISRSISPAAPLTSLVDTRSVGFLKSNKSSNSLADEILHSANNNELALIQKLDRNTILETINKFDELIPIISQTNSVRSNENSSKSSPVERMDSLIVNQQAANQQTNSILDELTQLSVARQAVQYQAQQAAAAAQAQLIQAAQQQAFQRIQLQMEREAQSQLQSQIAAYQSHIQSEVHRVAAIHFAQAEAQAMAQIHTQNQRMQAQMQLGAVDSHQTQLRAQAQALAQQAQLLLAAAEQSSHLQPRNQAHGNSQSQAFNHSHALGFTLNQPQLQSQSQSQLQSLPHPHSSQFPPQPMQQNSFPSNFPFPISPALQSLINQNQNQFR